jgi:putative transposase
MVLRWAAAAIMEAAKGFRRLKAYKYLPALKAALASLQLKHSPAVEENVKAA